jgi:phosphonopyruvate decarboxylase
VTSSSLFIKKLNNYGINFFVGVPDSLLKNFTDFILKKSNPKNNIIAAN